MFAGELKITKKEVVVFSIRLISNMCLGGLEDYGRKFTNVYQQTWQTKLRPKRWESGKRSPDLESQVISSPWSNTYWLSFLKSSYLDTPESALVKNKPRLSCYLLQGPVPRFDWRRDLLFPFEFFHRSPTPWVLKTFQFQSGIYQKHPPKVDFVDVSSMPATCEWEFQLLKSWCSNQPQKPIHER